MGSWMSVFHKMSSSQKTQLEYIKIDRHLEQRRKVKLSIIIMIFLISIGVIIYSVIHDVRRRNGSLIHLETLVCSQNDLECLSQLCPLSMRYNSEEDRCQG